MPPAARKLSRRFYARSALVVARELLGMYVVHDGPAGRQVGRIVETEAYQGPEDLAAHSSRGRTARTDVMFGPAGHAYVYLIYGFWNCLNVVAATRNVPHAVLIRALEPIEGMTDTTHGPGLLCRALHIDRSMNRADLLGDTLWIERPAQYRTPRIAEEKRIGVHYAGEWAHKPWRFLDRDSPYVSSITAAARRKALAALESAARPTDPSVAHQPARRALDKTAT